MQAPTAKPNGHSENDDWPPEHPENAGEASYEQEGEEMAVTRLHEEDKRDIARYVSEAGLGKRGPNIPAIVLGCFGLLGTFGGYFASSVGSISRDSQKVEALTERLNKADGEKTLQDTMISTWRERVIKAEAKIEFLEQKRGK